MKDGVPQPGRVSPPGAAGESDGARLRLLDAAESLFGERGFARTSVRDITTAANCNVAAVNYYFGGKRQLYRRVFDRWLGVLREHRLRAIRDAMSPRHGAVELEDLLGAFGRAFVEPVLAGGRGHVVIQLFLREMLDQQLPRDRFRLEVVEPLRTALGDAFRRICPHLDDRSIALCLHSTLAQLIHVMQAPLLLGDADAGTETLLDLPRVLAHVVHFSAAGIRACDARCAGGRCDD